MVKTAHLQNCPDVFLRLSGKLEVKVKQVMSHLTYTRIYRSNKLNQAAEASIILQFSHSKIGGVHGGRLEKAKPEGRAGR